MEFNITTTDLIYLVLGPGALLIGALLLRSDLRLQRRHDALQVEHAGLRESCAGLTGKLDELRDECHAVAERERQLRERVEQLHRDLQHVLLKDAETGPYFRAVRQAESGVGVDSLVERTGITRAEAALIVQLHGSSTVSPAPMQASA